MKQTIEELKRLQAQPLDIKITMTRQRIREWVEHFGEDGVYVSFSGGKDSTVLLDIVRQDYPNVPAMFVDAPTQLPELRDFAKTWDNVTIVSPHISFMEVCEIYGFPLISKNVSQVIYEAKNQAELNGIDVRETSLYYRSFNPESPYLKKYPHYSNEKYDFMFDADFNVSHKCCYVMKKMPAKRYEKETGRKAILGQMTIESRLRRTKWLQNGCNAFDVKRPISNPMSFWVEDNVLEYIATRNLPICSLYGEVVEDYEKEGQTEGQLSFCDCKKIYKTTGCDRTGCAMCGFSVHLDKAPSRFERLKETHPGMYRLLDKIKNNGVTYREAIEWVNEHGNMNIRL